MGGYLCKYVCVCVLGVRGCLWVADWLGCAVCLHVGE